MTEHFKLIAEGLDVAPLVARLQQNESLWSERTERQHYPGSAHKDTETIYLRWAVDQTVFGGFYCLASEDHVDTVKRLEPEVYRPVMQSLRHILPGAEYWDIGRVILTRMKPGGVITEHVDEGPYADKYERFHVCLSGYSSFFVEDEEQRMKPGELWWFNHKLRHQVLNTMHDRIHLIIDLVAPEYRKLRGLTFQRERSVDLWAEAMPLFEKHYHEIAFYPDIKLVINQELYNQLDEAGIIRAYTARMNGDLIGYCVFKISPNPRYMHSIQAVQDVLFLLPEYRGKSAGVRLIKYCEQRLKADGCQVVFQHTKAASNVGKLLERLGYEHIDNVYGKRLDKEAS